MPTRKGRRRFIRHGVSGRETFGPFLSQFQLLSGTGIHGVRSARNAARPTHVAGRLSSEGVRPNAPQWRGAHARDRHYAQGTWLYRTPPNLQWRPWLALGPL